MCVGVCVLGGAKVINRVDGIRLTESSVEVCTACRRGMLGDGADGINLLTNTGRCGLKESGVVYYLSMNVRITANLTTHQMYTSRLMRSDKWPRGRAYSLMRVKVTGNNGIKEFKCRWEKVFMKWNIPQPELSVRFILDHVWQKTTGNRAAVSRLNIWLTNAIN